MTETHDQTIYLSSVHQTDQGLS